MKTALRVSLPLVIIFCFLSSQAQAKTTYLFPRKAVQNSFTVQPHGKNPAAALNDSSQGVTSLAKKPKPLNKGGAQIFTDKANRKASFLLTPFTLPAGQSIVGVNIYAYSASAAGSVLKLSASYPGTGSGANRLYGGSKAKGGGWRKLTVKALNNAQQINKLKVNLQSQAYHQEPFNQLTVSAIIVAVNTRKTPSNPNQPKPPATPQLTGTNPPSGSNNNHPLVQGTAESGSTISIYKSSNCTGDVAASGSAEQFPTGIGLDVADNTSTLISAKATNAAGASACAKGLIYTENTPPPPGAPIFSGVSPPSGSASTTPLIAGIALTGSTVKLYTNPNCTGSAVATGSADAFNSPGLQVTVGTNSTTTFWATATANDGTSTCSLSNISYTQNPASAPAAPSVNSVNPSIPSNNNNPVITGSAESGSTVNLYNNSSCSGSPVASGSAASFQAPGITANVADNTTTTFYANATNINGTSPCSTSFVTYVEDSAAPVSPTLTSTNPASPSSDLTPNIIGNAEAGSTVKLYTNSACTGSATGLGSAADFGSIGITVVVAQNATTTFWATATDGAGNISPCSVSSISYTEVG